MEHSASNELPSISAVIVSYGDPESARLAIQSLRAQVRRPKEIILVDNHPELQTAAAFEDEPGVKVVCPASNDGFAGGTGAGAAHATGDYLLFLNPDAVMARDALAVLAGELDTHPDAAVAGAQILLPDGHVNAGDNPIHLTGLSWSGRYTQSPQFGPAYDTLSLSGACILVRDIAYRQLGGMTAKYFLYYEDCDFCWRARLRGWSVRFCPDAHVTHDYAFDKGAAKWRYLERNRIWMIAANYERGTLIRLAPMLAASEVAIWLSAARGGWSEQKRAAWGDVFSNLRWLRRQRRNVQSSRTIGDLQLIAEFSGTVTSPLLSGPAVSLANPVFELYKRLLIRSLRHHEKRRAATGAHAD